jgi:hypothetical protein
MWIMTTNAYLSIVAYTPNPAMLYVRARLNGDIQAVFPNAKVEHTPDCADYAYRAVVRRAEVATALTSQALEIDYPNFKDAVPNNDRHDVYMDIWCIWKRVQDHEQALLLSERTYAKKWGEANTKKAKKKGKNKKKA